MKNIILIIICLFFSFSSKSEEEIFKSLNLPNYEYKIFKEYVESVAEMNAILNYCNFDEDFMGRENWLFQNIDILYDNKTTKDAVFYFSNLYFENYNEFFDMLKRTVKENETFPYCEIAGPGRFEYKNLISSRSFDKILEIYNQSNAIFLECHVIDEVTSISWQKFWRINFDSKKATLKKHFISEDIMHHAYFEVKDIKQTGNMIVGYKLWRYLDTIDNDMENIIKGVFAAEYPRDESYKNKVEIIFKKKTNENFISKLKFYTLEGGEEYLNGNCKNIDSRIFHSIESEITQ